MESLNSFRAGTHLGAKTPLKEKRPGPFRFRPLSCVRNRRSADAGADACAGVGTMAADRAADRAAAAEAPVTAAAAPTPMTATAPAPMLDSGADVGRGGGVTDRRSADGCSRKARRADKPDAERYQHRKQHSSHTVLLCSFFKFDEVDDPAAPLPPGS